MPPLRRYLRITKYSVLECRIYVDNPADVSRWLLHSNAPVLPRVIEAVRPLVLPKLREENARSKDGKGGKKRGWKDVVVEDDFEVAVFLTEVSARHSILRKEKRALGEMKPRLGTTQGKLTGAGTRDMPVEVDQDGDVEVIREEISETRLELLDIPLSKHSGEPLKPGSGVEEGLFVSDGSEEETQKPRSARRQPQKRGSESIDFDGGEDDKKKLKLHTTYDGFSIYGRILCLVVKRRGLTRGKEPVRGTGQAMMEEWITSTQRSEPQMMDDYI
ncbi:hypothetical protein MMC31_003179 [Peltigera leucophlebia]|nr:hypothetical protein [Peltigera leucophlebia]